LSIFNRIAAIENKINSIETRLDTGLGPSVGHGGKHFPGQGTPQKGGAEFEQIINSMTDGQKFKPGAGAAAPSAQQQMNSASVRPIVQEAAGKYNLDPCLIEAVIKQESAYDANATSCVGAQGLMQLMPETAEWLGVKNPYDARENVMGGAKYLSQLMDRFDGDLTKVIASYNAGPTTVAEYGGVPPYPETQNYVEKVLKNYGDFKA